MSEIHRKKDVNMKIDDLSQRLIPLEQGLKSIDIIESGTKTISVSCGGSDCVTSSNLSHNLGFKPVLIASVVPPAGVLQMLPFFSVVWSAADNAFMIVAEAEANQLNNNTIEFKVHSNGAGGYDGTWSFKYYLLSEEAV